MSYTEESLRKMHLKAVASYKSMKLFTLKLKRIQPQKLDKLMCDQHKQEFSKINCLECANCCKTISPAMYDSDIKRIAIALKMKPSDVIYTYLQLDKDGEYIFRNTPCPFFR